MFFWLRRDSVSRSFRPAWPSHIANGTYPSIYLSIHQNFTVSIQPNALLVSLSLSHNSPTEAVGKCCYYRWGIKGNQWEPREPVQSHRQSQNLSGLLWPSQLKGPPFFLTVPVQVKGHMQRGKEGFNLQNGSWELTQLLLIAAHLRSSDW